MRKKQPLLVVISAPDIRTNEEEITRALFEEGLEWYHLRKPHVSVQEVRSLMESLEGHHSKVVLHSHYELLEEYEFGGVHLKQTFTTSYPSSKCSLSLHALEELKEQKAQMNYVFLSPIFESISKPGYVSKFDRDELKNALKSTQQRVVALGGVSLHTLQDARDYGAHGVAVLGAVWGERQPLSAFEAINKEFKSIFYES